MAKIVVVTGAGAGVGRATVEEFARHGYDVALLSRDPDRLAKAADALRRDDVRALTIPPTSPTPTRSKRRPNGSRTSSGQSTCGSTWRWRPSSPPFIN